MKKIFFMLLATVSLALSSCEKEESGSTIDGLWYIRTEIEQVSSADEPITTYYKLYKRIDVANKRYTTFNFSGNRLLVDEYTRDQNINRDIINTTEYTYSTNGSNITLVGKDGTSKSYDYEFMGLSSKSLKLEFLEKIIDQNHVQQTKSSKTLLIREFPIDESEGEVIGPQPNPGTPTEPR